MNQHEKIKEIMQALKTKYPVLTVNSGIGYCAYGSQLLATALRHEGIKASILVGDHLAGTVQSNLAVKAAAVIIMAIPLTNDPNDLSSNLKKAYIRRGHRMLAGVGHAVVLVGDIVYDITSGQFGNPEVYTLTKFTATWAGAYFAEVEIKDSADFGVVKITSLKKSFAAKW